MKIIKIILLFIVISIFSTEVSASSFANLSTGNTGSVNTGNGYFDNPQTTFGYTGDRNVYVISEDTQIWVLEPISWTGGTSPQAFQVINSSFGTIKDGVVHTGYLYFVDGTTLKKKKSRNDNSLCESNDTAVPNGCIITVLSGVGETLRVYNNVLYFTVGTTLKHLDSQDNVVSDFAMGTVPGGETQYRGFTVTLNGSDIQTYNAWFTGAAVSVHTCTSSGCVNQYNPNNNAPMFDTFYTTTNDVFAYTCSTGGGCGAQTQYLITVSNGTKIVQTIINTGVPHANRAYVGGQSTVGLLAQTTTTYETFNSDEAGIDSLSAVPAQITYTTKTIESLDSQYYNKSTIYLEYNVVINSVNVNNLLLDLNNYRWMISMTDPNGVTTDVIQSPACSTTSVLDTSCQVTSTMGIKAPSAGWLQGTWYAKLYEINIVDPNRALIATSSSFTVLNTTIENQSVIPPPDTNLPTSGTAPQAITLIDGFVTWLGMGVNSVSKLLFAMIFIAIATTVGLIWGNGNIAMVFAFIPYAFFTFIDYIPKWIFIITIILIAIASRVFR